jgi:hypothetical protein
MTQVAHATPAATNAGVSLLHLYALRALYALIAFGLGSEIWPLVVQHATPFPLMRGVALSLLAALSAVALLGIRYPLQMLPLLFFEMAWKAIWLLAFAVPLGLSGQIDPAAMETITACLMAVVVPLVIPWSYVFENYLQKPGDRWH